MDTSLVFYFVLTFAVNSLLLWESGNPIDSWRSCYDIGDRACYIILWAILILGIYTIIHQVTGQGIVISWK